MPDATSAATAGTVLPVLSVPLADSVKTVLVARVASGVTDAWTVWTVSIASAVLGSGVRGELRVARLELLETAVCAQHRRLLDWKWRSWGHGWMDRNKIGIAGLCILDVSGPLIRYDDDERKHEL